MDLKLADGNKLALPGTQGGAARYVADMFVRQGTIPGTEDQVPWNSFYSSNLSPKVMDAINSTEIRPLLEQSMQILIREPVEPLAVITGLYNRVQSRGMTHQILAGAMGAVYAGDIGEGQPYPEVNFQIGGAVQTAWIGKSGIAAAFSDEALRYSTWDIMAMNLSLMGKAMVRHKEQKAVAFLRNLGTTLYDNVAPSDSLFGVMTGRGLDMAANGSMTMDDLFRAIAHMSEEGFAPDVILVNPLFYLMYCQDQVLRNIFVNGTGGGAYFRQWNGNNGPRDPWSNGAMGAAGPTIGHKIIPGGTTSGESPSSTLERSPLMNATFPMPGYLGWNLNIVVSPLVPFDPETQLGDVYLLSSGNVGHYLVDEDLTQVEWRMESQEVVKVKYRERYGFAVAYEGQGVGVMKNVKLTRNYWDGTIKATTMEVLDEIAPDSVIDLD